MERTVARVWREAGATVRCNCRLHDMSVTVRADDERVLEVLASGLPLHHGPHNRLSTSPSGPALTLTGLPSPNAAHVNGAALARARRDKERQHGELLGRGWCGNGQPTRCIWRASAEG